MPKIYYQEDCSLSLLGSKTIAVISYGSQGHAHALDLKESGHNVIVGLYESSRPWEKAQEQGSEVYTTVGASKKTDVIMILINDKKQTATYKGSIASDLRPGTTLMFAHDFAIHFGQIAPPKDMDATMITPRTPGHTVRSEYRRGRGTPHLVVVYQGATGKAMDMALTYGQGIGDARAGILETTFKVGIETDLFDEQAVLCGNVCALMKAGFKALVETSYAPENACFGCMHEVELIVDLIYESGFAGMRYSISNTAKYGDYIIRPGTVTDETKKAIKKILSDIQDGSFTKKWLLENQVGCSHFNAMKENEAEQPLEKMGAELRKFYSWNDTDKLINS